MTTAEQAQQAQLAALEARVVRLERLLALAVRLAGPRIPAPLRAALGRGVRAGAG